MVRALKDILKEINDRERPPVRFGFGGPSGEGMGGFGGDSRGGSEGPGRDHGEFAQRDYGGDSKRHGLGGGRDHAEFAQRTPTPPDPGQDDMDDDFEDPGAVKSLENELSRIVAQNLAQQIMTTPPPTPQRTTFKQTQPAQNIPDTKNYGPFGDPTFNTPAKEITTPEHSLDQLAAINALAKNIGITKEVTTPEHALDQLAAINAPPTPTDIGQDDMDDDFSDPHAMAKVKADQVQGLIAQQNKIPGITEDNKHVDPEWQALEQQKNAIFQGMTPAELNAMNKDFGRALGIGLQLIGGVAPGFLSPTSLITSLIQQGVDPTSYANQSKLGQAVQENISGFLSPIPGSADFGNPGYVGPDPTQQRKQGGIIGLANGGDMGQDDTLGEEDEGNVTASDVEGMQQAYEMTPQEVTSFVDEANLGQGRVDQQFDILDAARRQQGTDKQPVASLEQGIDYLDSIYDPAKSLWGMIPQTKEDAAMGLGKAGLASVFGIPALASGLLGLAYNAYDRSRERESFEESLAKQGIKGSWTNQAPAAFDYTRNYNNPNDMGSDEGYEPLKFTTKVAQEMINPTITNLPSMPVSKGWDLSNLLRVAKSGGPIEAYQGGGITSMMRQKPTPWNPQGIDYVAGPRPYLGGNPYSPYPYRPPNSMIWDPPRPPRDHDHKKDLNPDTYFHEHEAGQVRYPNFPTQQPITNTDNPSKKTPHPGVVIDDFGHPMQPTIDPPVSPSFTETITQEQVTAEAPPRPEKIDIEMPQDVTATLDFPEEIVGTPRYNRGGNIMNYNHGGLTGLAYTYPEKYNIGGFLKSILPALAGGAAMMIPGLGQMASPWIVGGLTGAATGALTGGKKDRSLLGLAKNFLMGGSGASAAGTANPALTKGFVGPPTKVPTFMSNVTDTASALGSQWDSMGAGDLLKTYAGPLAGTVAAQSIQPQTPYNLSEIDVARVKTMTPEERQKFFEEQRKKYPSNLAEAGLTFQQPNVDIGFPYPPSYAAEGGVMEVEEEMESGSFVLPADVVSNVGDGSSTAGHRRLTELFGGEEEYALGGGTGILKGPIKGPGGGLDDLIQTGIDGVRVARLSTDEFVVPKDVVRRIGNGSQKAGAEELYDFMKNVRLNKHGTSQQPKGINMAGLKKMV